MRLVTLSLRCHNSQEDAPDHEAADAEYPVAPIFRHVANMACGPCRQTPGADQRLERGSTALMPRERLDLRLNVASSPLNGTGTRPVVWAIPTRHMTFSWFSWSLHC